MVLRVIFSLFLSINFGICQELQYKQPKILREFDDSNDFILNPGSNYNLTCESDRPLTWRYPTRSEINWTWFNITEDNHDLKKHVSILQIYNMTYPFVGYYMCCTIEYCTTVNPESDQVYLYVNDTQHLSVEEAHIMHYAVQNLETTIPCRPTMPDVYVELVSTSLEMLISNRNIQYSYDPKYGITFNDTQTIGPTLIFCHFIRSNCNPVDIPVNLYIELPRQQIAPTYIEDISNNHTDEGETLNLTCTVQDSAIQIHFNWQTPRGNYSSNNYKPGDVRIQTTYTNKRKWAVSQLTIKNATTADSGLYNCTVEDQQQHVDSVLQTIWVHSLDDCYIQISEENEQYSLTIEAGKEIIWVLDVIAHPPPDLIWYDKDGNILTNNSDFKTEMLTTDKTMFTITNGSIDHSGEYKLKGTSRREHITKNCPKIDEITLKLNVIDKPTVCLSQTHGNCLISSEPQFFLINSETIINCEAKGNPYPIIEWIFFCSHEDCNKTQISSMNGTNFTSQSIYKVNTKINGNLTCTASNDLGTSKTTLEYYVTNFKDGFDLTDFDTKALVPNMHEMIVAENETFKFTCGVHPRKANSLTVFFNDDQLDERYEVATSEDQYSINLTVKLNLAQFSASGLYSCKIVNINTQADEYRNITLKVQEPEMPQIVHTNLDEEIVVDYPTMPKNLYCFAQGIPKPTIEWYKDNELVNPTNQVIFLNDSQILRLNRTELADEGIYECRVINSQSTISRKAFLKIKGGRVSSLIYYSIGIISLLLTSCFVTLTIKANMSRRKYKRKLKELGLETFHKGSPENLNPDLGIYEQVDLLPYDKVFEFPRERLKFGKQLGAGAFGVVMRATAKGIVPGEPITTVAVKMVKPTADVSYIKALASELKIMVHLGKHINVVNLLGACTNNVVERQLWVIVEFCRFGSLQNYLYKHRNLFINQVDPTSGEVDYRIGADTLARTYSNSSDNQSPGYNRNNSMTTQFSYNTEESVIMSNNSYQPEWRVNYKGDYRDASRYICTKDLLCWSFQVAKGMEYLAMRKVLHGDLAARNVLLADNNVVKICDFGLAKTMYNDKNYKKKGDSPLPIKWMAIESIRDRIFSTQSDVWSFGIVLWEFFSLAQNPYPGMEPDQKFYIKLLEGYRMEAPPRTPKKIYDIMLDCWHAKPLSRPTFSQLGDAIGNILEENERKHYVDLNDPYLKMNTEKRQEDYLAMVSSPCFEVISTPTVHYSNDNVFFEPSNAQSTDGYTAMGATNIFSPRIQQNNTFSFPASIAAPTLFQQPPQDPNSPYLEPMTPTNSIPNPSYFKFPTSENNFITSQDNYISRPDCINLKNKNNLGLQKMEVVYKNDPNQTLYVNV